MGARIISRPVIMYGSRRENAFSLLEARDKNKGPILFPVDAHTGTIETLPFFPIGGLCEARSAENSERSGIADGGKKDSKGICFWARWNSMNF